MGIRLDRVTAGYEPGHAVLRSMNLDVASSEILGVLGASGSGKSTLLHVIAGIIPVLSGSVEIDGDDHTRTPMERRRVGFVPQDGVLFPHLSVAQNVAFGLSRAARRVPLRAPRVLEILDLVQLADVGTRMPHELSGGQQKRIALARALAPRPSVVLLDEPFSALDGPMREEVRTQLLAALRAERVSGILVTHDRDEAFAAADRIAIIREGQIAQSGTPSELYGAPLDEWIAQVTGDIVPERLRAIVSGVLAGDVPCPLRPEQISLAPDETAAAHGTVASVSIRGATSLVRIRLDAFPEETLPALTLWPSATHVGQRVRISIRPCASSENGSR